MTVGDANLGTGTVVAQLRNGQYMYRVKCSRQESRWWYDGISEYIGQVVEHTESVITSHYK